MVIAFYISFTVWGKDYLKNLGYKIVRLASPDLPCWICWPAKKQQPYKLPEPTQEP